MVCPYCNKQETNVVDSRKNNEGKQVPGGTYYYLLKYTGPRGEPFEERGRWKSSVSES